MKRRHPGIEPDLLWIEVILMRDNPKMHHFRVERLVPPCGTFSAQLNTLFLYVFC